MIAASAARLLLIGKVDGAMRSVPRGPRPVRRCWSNRLPARNAACRAKIVSASSGFERGQIEHAFAHSAVIVMEMSAALAECVSAPTLIKSTPVSA